MTWRLVVLGGSSPFTVGLFDAIADSTLEADAVTVILHGRDRRALELVARYGRRRVGPKGWNVTGTADADAALEGANVVLHQIRYGDLAGRADDEGLAASLGVPSDETLGPAGLAAALRMAPQLSATAAQLRRSCSSASILNLTNPLSVSTTLLLEHGVTNTVGLCELPQATLAEACRVLDVAGGQVEWSYTGLNHRGFLHDVRLDGRDLLEELTDRLGGDTIGGITAATIAELHALPLKYFLLFIAPQPPRSSWAIYLARLREQVMRELAADEFQSPPSLAGRSQPWYPDAVVPALAGILGGVPVELAVSAAAPDGLAWERRCQLGREGPVFVPSQPAPTAVMRWNDHFAEHERCVLAAVRAPSRARLRAALAADPLVPADRLDQAVDAIRSTIDR